MLGEQFFFNHVLNTGVSSSVALVPRETAQSTQSF